MSWEQEIALIRTTDLEYHLNFLRHTYMNALEHSPDPSTKTGAIITTDRGEFISAGVNHFPTGVVPTPEQLADREWRMRNIIHAEPSAVHAAARRGQYPTRGATMYMPWVPCYDCAKVIIDAGITRLIGHEQFITMTPLDWREDIASALELLRQAHVERVMYQGIIGNVDGFFRGKSWKP